MYVSMYVSNDGVSKPKRHESQVGPDPTVVGDLTPSSHL